MEYIYGFICGCILAHTIAYVLYKNNIDEVRMIYNRKMKNLEEVLNEYYRL